MFLSHEMLLLQMHPYYVTNLEWNWHSLEIVKVLVMPFIPLQLSFTFMCIFGSYCTNEVAFY